MRRIVVNPVVDTKSKNGKEEIIKYIQENAKIRGTKKACFITNQQIKQLFDLSKEELIVSLRQLKEDRKIFGFHIGRSGVTIFLSSGGNGSTPRNIGYDVFVSHATKDKIPYVNELYKELKKLGVKIFYDQVELSWGDNWKTRIIEATKQSEFAIIVISKNFFDREWTERELKTFLSRQNKSGQKIILPILYNVTQEEFLSHYPKLKEIQYITSEKNSKKDIAILFAKEYIKRIKK